MLATQFAHTAASHRRLAATADTTTERTHWELEAERFEQLAKLAETDPIEARRRYRPTVAYEPQPDRRPPFRSDTGGTDMAQETTTDVAAAVRADYEAGQMHIEEANFDCCSGHRVARSVPALLAENERLRRDLADQIEETQQIAAELAQERTQINEAADTLIGSVENGPWVLITDPTLRQIVGEYIADACHSIAAAAGLDEAMERAHDAMPLRLARSLPPANVGESS